MKYFQETTVWTDVGAKNGIYYLSDDKQWMVGYTKYGSTEMTTFKNPIRIDTRGRKFTVIKDGETDSVYFGKKEEVKQEGVEVLGSDGTKYYVNKLGNGYTCTCKGFQFRHKCRHVDTVKEVA